jgi:GNAT superfamily N-acetyltransferase
VKIMRVRANNRRQAFEVRVGRRVLNFPWARAEPVPRPTNRIRALYVDPELGGQGFTYVLENGDEGSVLLDHVLDYNSDPGYLRELLLYRLTLEAQERLATCGLSHREIIRRLGTSPAQFYRLLDQTNDRKTVDRMLELLHVLGCEVQLVVSARRRQTCGRS